MKDTLYNGRLIRVSSGKYVDVFAPTEDMIDINDIAHGLANKCRFGGHTQEFFTVAQHSINCLFLVNKEHKLAALLHDAAEAYISDIPTPIKRELKQYCDIEENLMKVIASKFKIEYPFHHSIKSADKVSLEWEWQNYVLHDKIVQDLIPLTTTEAKSSFLRYFDLYKI